MKRNAWLLLAVLPVGLAGYVLTRSPAPAPITAKETTGTDLPQLLAEAIGTHHSTSSTASNTNTPGSTADPLSAPASPPRTASDTNTPGPSADPFSTPPSLRANASGMNRSAPTGNTYGVRRYVYPGASDQTVPPRLIWQRNRVQASRPLTPGEAAEREQALAAEKGRSNIATFGWKEQEKIETWYTYETTKLLGLLEQRMQKVNAGEKPSWDYFYQLAKKAWPSPESMEYRAVFSSRSQSLPLGKSWAAQYEASLSRLQGSPRSTQDDFRTAICQLGLLRTEKRNELQRCLDRQWTVEHLNESRAQKETARKRAGDGTPLVETIAAVGDNQFCALIGGAMVREGSTVQGYRVQKIRADSVEFEKDGKVWVQRVP